MYKNNVTQSRHIQLDIHMKANIICTLYMYIYIRKIKTKKEKYKTVSDTKYGFMDRKE